MRELSFALKRFGRSDNYEQSHPFNSSAERMHYKVSLPSTIYASFRKRFWKAREYEREYGDIIAVYSGFLKWIKWTKLCQREINIALKQRCNEEVNPLSWAERYFYTLKGIICLLLKREKSFCGRDEWLNIALYDQWEDDDGNENWTEFAVGFGVFREWYYDIYQEGS